MNFSKSRKIESRLVRSMRNDLTKTAPGIMYLEMLENIIFLRLLTLTSEQGAASHQSPVAGLTSPVNPSTELRLPKRSRSGEIT